MATGRVRLQLVLLDNNEQVETTDAYMLVGLPVGAPKSVVAIFSIRPHLRDVSMVDLTSERVVLLLGCHVPDAYWIQKQMVV